MREGRVKSLCIILKNGKQQKNNLHSQNNP